ncbi:ABC transporter ATP-binding protein [Novilysobacter avium]|uniref:ABC transporter ATP-binding protein n=1 Tax=Novilysobacter avium TaxID=2781023 RepID=A0A7S6UJX9_9GAMM|nr:ABC transporter ATP-binding protein [Lysobacter avium]QOW21683.1 ABC transporter ATP-binding protein [Lysobacter avium]
MSAFIRADRINLDVPIFLQREREATGWGGMFLGAAFDTPKRSLIRLLDDISFEIREGDRLAILGRNGAGKSTLLRVLNRVYQPTSGELTVQGSCQALLNMSLGFSGEATVRENIFLRGIAMGLKAAFLRPQVESILEFAGLEHKVNHRLRTLSSGQKMRLGFAISTSVQHDIMLMDEWVGAGDSEFMAKAKERMQSRVGGSKIVVLASHSVGLLRDMCNKGIVLEGGKLAYAGDITSSLKCYHGMMAQLRANKVITIEDAAPSPAAQIYGVIEEIRQGDGDGLFLVKGWMVDTEGALPSGIALEMDGHRYVAHAVERVRRPDVMRHLGLHTDECGFLASVHVSGVLRPSQLGEQLRVLGGSSSDHADAPLRIAAAVAATLRETD